MKIPTNPRRDLRLNCYVQLKSKIMEGNFVNHNLFWRLQLKSVFYIYGDILVLHSCRDKKNTVTLARAVAYNLSHIHMHT